MLGRLVNEKLKAASPYHPWGDMLPLFRSADVRICNLECVIADGGTPWQPKVFNFRSDARNVQALKVAGIDCVSLANNHTLDYGDDGLLEMLDILDRAQIKHAGAGTNIRAAMRPIALRVGDLRVGLVSFTDNEAQWEAAPHRPGVFYVPIDVHDVRAQKLLKIVSYVKARVDLVIVAAHWGPNWGRRPQPEHIPVAHALVEAGADIIFGHSCHVFQGIEFYRGAVILYSCGDFVDDYRVDKIERNDQCFIFVVEIERRRIVRLKLYPTVITHYQAQLAKDTEAEEIVRKMQIRCDEFGTASVWREDQRCLDVFAAVQSV
jgi:poly-gamma-glutamate synthesis protein (capsule biosynthesis protein)